LGLTLLDHTDRVLLSPLPRTNRDPREIELSVAISISTRMQIDQLDGLANKGLDYVQGKAPFVRRHLPFRSCPL
jgi:hypothetical protein